MHPVDWSTIKRKKQAFLKEITPRARSFSRSARTIGYFVIFYISTIALTVLVFAAIGVASIAIPIAMMPVAAWFAYRMARASEAATQQNGK